MKAIRLKKPHLLIFLAVIVCFVFAVDVLAQQKDKKADKADKVWGTIVTQPAGAAGTGAAVALETQKKEIVPLVNNAVAKKLEKIVGKKVEVEGRIKQVDGKNVLEPWIFVQKDKPAAPAK